MKRQMRHEEHISSIDIRLRAELDPLARHLRARRFHQRSVLVWIIVLLCMLAVVGTCVVLGISALDSAAALATTGGLGCAVVYAWTGRIPRDYRRAAAMVERAHPDLAQALETALEQQPGSGR
ncbi:MAG TPA: hypothetical protein VGA56_11775, partial [Opitutaceae bacterium]